MKIHNFSAGPSILSQYTIEETAKALIDFAGTGLSLMEVSHRSKEFVAVMEEAVALVKELLEVPDTHEVIFLGGGASTQFLYAPYNLMKSKAAYLNTGAWANKAMKEAHYFGEVVEVASSKDAVYNYIPEYEVPSDVDYFHYTSNNTIYGTQIKKDPEVSVPLVSDMSSDIFSRPIDFSKYDMVYAGAQKNLAPAGVTLVIVRTEALGKTDREIPTMVDFRTHIKAGSMFNTPPVVPVFSALQTLKWYKAQGGIAGMQKLNAAKAKLLYDEIDRNAMFKCPVPNPKDRSEMNVCFVMAEGYEDKEKAFFEFASSKGMSGFKGHRTVGGFRASIYNAMPIESVQALVDCMKEFEANN